MLNAPKLSAPTDPWEKLLALIREQTSWPAAEPYIQPAGDPLDRLIRRMHGEDVDAVAASGAPTSRGTGVATLGQGASPVAAGVEALLGREVLEMLRAAGLPGPARAAAAALLSAQLHGLEDASAATPSGAEVADGLRAVLRILVTTQFE